MSYQAGRLASFLPAWKLLTKDAVILSWISGYKIPFSKEVKQNQVPQEPRWTKAESEQINNQITHLLEIGAITQCVALKGQFISKIFLIQKSNGKCRLILNLKGLNCFIDTVHFKLEDKSTASKLITHNCFMSTIDLKDAYFLINVHHSHRKFLRFQFRNKLYEFTCLPFGLNTAPYVFTKILKPVVASLRLEGLLSVIYLDDFLLLGNSVTTCQRNSIRTINLLESLGFIINKEKSQLFPNKVCKFLGFIFNSEEMSITLPEDKQVSILKLMSDLLKNKNYTIRRFSQIVGTLISACPAVKYGWLHTKLFERAKYLALLTSKGNYNRLMSIPPSLHTDINWWVNTISLTKMSLTKDKLFCVEIFSDASTTGWGAVCNQQKAAGHWSMKESTHHINYLELMSAFFGLKCFAGHLHNRSILLRIDNTTAISYINKMGGVRFSKLNALAREIWLWCEARNLWIFTSYISSSENKEADEESRKLASETEWELHSSAFQIITQDFNLPDIDLFANRLNKKCEKFISWKSDPEALVVDAFTINWHHIKFYAFPPFALILRTLQKILNDKATGIVVVPLWETQPWFPLFKSMLKTEPIYFSPHINLLTCPFTRKPHPLWRKTTLVAGLLSWKPTG